MPRIFACIKCLKEVKIRESKFNFGTNKHCSYECRYGFDIKKRFESKVIKKSDNQCWDWNASSDQGYGVIRIKNVRWRAHVLSWVINFGEIQEGLCVLHKCDNRICSNPKHLFLGTRTDNNSDMVAKKRNKFFVGEDNPRATLDNEQVKQIKILLSKKIPDATIAIDLNIPICRIRSIKYEKNWKTVKI